MPYGARVPALGRIARAARSLRNQPGYFATAIAIPAIVIGVNSAFFILFSHHVLKHGAGIISNERRFELGLARVQYDVPIRRAQLSLVCFAIHALEAEIYRPYLVNW